MNDKITETHLSRVAAHYANAMEKHPRFADAIDYHLNAEYARRALATRRSMLLADNKSGYVTARDVLDCEVLEIYEAWHMVRFADAVEECYDAIAVLLRMADMIAAEADGAKEGGAK